MKAKSPRLATITEGARVAGKHEATIRRWVKNGELTAWRVNRCDIRVDLNEIEELLRPIPLDRPAMLDSAAKLGRVVLVDPAPLGVGPAHSSAVIPGTS